jgi:hypothetical protein
MEAIAVMASTLSRRASIASCGARGRRRVTREGNTLGKIGGQATRPISTG